MWWSPLNWSTECFASDTLCIMKGLTQERNHLPVPNVKKAFNQSGNLKVHERTHTEPLNNKNISLQAMWKDIWMILNLWNLEAAGIWSDSIPIPHQISIPQYFKTSEPQYQYQYQQNWKPQYQYQYQYHSKPQYLNTWYWYCLCLFSTKSAIFLCY